MQIPELIWQSQMKELSGLFVVCTPIGHREDLSLRALQTLACVDAILCEDTRETLKLLKYYHIEKPCFSYHEHNEQRISNVILDKLKSGVRLALVSDRGTPGICDAGPFLVSLCHQNDIPVHFLPGPCAGVMGLVLAGFGPGPFFFQGFLPRRKGSAIKLLDSLKALKGSLIFFESPYRVQKILEVLQEALGDRPACVLRELTKKFEQSQRGLLSQLRQQVTKPMGEYVIVVHGALRSNLKEDSNEEEEVTSRGEFESSYQKKLQKL